MDQHEFFYRLTPQTIMDSAEKEGFITTGLCIKLNSMENRVYDLELTDRSHVVVKFYRPGRWNRQQILEEHEFLLDLQTAEVPVCAPLSLSNGSTVSEIENLYYAVWPRTGGRCVDEFSREQIESLGRLLGRIHAVGKTKQAPGRLALTSDNLGRKPLAFLLEQSMIPSDLENRYTEAVTAVCGIYDEYSKDVPFYRIHGDCHIGNLLFRDGGFYFLDFDDFYTGPAVQDFWMLIPNDKTGKGQLRSLVENYRSFNDFEDAWLKLIEPLRALRFIHYSSWIARRWEDLSFQNAFPHFGTREYWLGETKDLEEQLKIIEKESLPPGQKADEPELTNKDFFWDWED
ncbi:MAG: serine/threonine protein kinase [Spirochaetales bacterium]|nr:serine/threonine protein kinase [Spirochaetales bacterium]